MTDGKKYAVIIGSTHGIGRACAIKFLSEGFIVLGCGHNPEDERGQEMERQYKDYHHVIADVSSEDDMHRFFCDEVSAFTGGEKLSLVLVCSGTGIAPLPADKINVSSAKHVISVNLIGTALVLKFALSNLEEGSCFAVLGSIAADTPSTGADWSYSSSKAGIPPVLKEAANDERFQGIAFVHFRLGYIRTRMTAMDDQHEWLKKTPYAEVGNPEDTARKIFSVTANAKKGYSEVSIIGGGIPNKYPKQRLKGRMAGVLAPVFSLPGKYSCGTLGDEAYRFIDIISQGGFRYWMMLPHTPTGYGDSPYSPLSSIGGNINLISPDILQRENLLSKDFCNSLHSESMRIDYEKCCKLQRKMIREAWKIFQKLPENHSLKQEFEVFSAENGEWLYDFSLYFAVKDFYNGSAWQDWDNDGLRNRDSIALNGFAREHEDNIHFWAFTQFIFFRQLKDLRSYAESKGVFLIGDMPFYVNEDSCDTWSSRELFCIDSQTGRTMKFSGTPHKDTRHWGCPAYSWEKHIDDGCKWWRRRVLHYAQYFDGLRIDHAIALRKSYVIPSDGCKPQWEDGADILYDNILSQAIQNEAAKFGTVIFAEDLGVVPEGLRERIESLGWFTIRLIQYASKICYGSHNDHSPINYTRKQMIFTSTHDSNPLQGYLAGLQEYDLKYFMYMMNAVSPDNLYDAVMKAAYFSCPQFCTVALQDIMKLENEARMSDHKSFKNSWKWRAESLDAILPLMPDFKRLAVLSGRFQAGRTEFISVIEGVAL